MGETNKYTFSVLVPNYGYSKYIFDCLDSIVNQVNNSNFTYEIIVCDQSENDVFHKLSDEIINRYSDRVTLIHSDIRGLFRARHTLINHSSGEYIVFIDSDDFIDADYLQTLFNCLNRKNIDLLFVSLKKCDEKGKEIASSRLNSINSDNVKDYFLFSSYLNSACIKIFKKELYEISDYQNLDFDIKNGEDFVFTYPIVIRSKVVSYRPDIAKYNYRVVSTSMTHKFSFEECKRTILLKNDYLKGYKYTPLQSAIRLRDLINYLSVSTQFLIKQNGIDKKQFIDYYNLLCKLIKEEKLKNTAQLNKKQRIIYRLIKLKWRCALWKILKKASKRIK